MRILSLAMIGTGAVLMGLSAPAMANGPAGAPAMRHGWSGANNGWSQAHRWGPRYQGRWYAGARAPGGWGAYRRPVYGYVLPRYWVNPTYYIANYGAYGLPAPAAGYGWSRYYDDAVMTDRYGRVYDHRRDIDWGRYEGGYGPDGDYDDGYYADAPRRDNGVGGAAIGAVVGGVAGNRIAGRGNRTVGTIVGAGVGAVAGAAIDRAEDAPHHDGPPPPHRPGAEYDHGGYRYADDAVTGGGDDYDYEGRWTGTWTTEDGRQVKGSYDGRFEGQVSGAGVDYAPPPYGGPSHWDGGPAVQQGGGYIANGYYYPAPTVTTVTIQPEVTTTTTTTYVTERVPYRKTVRKPRRSCHCK